MAQVTPTPLFGPSALAAAMAPESYQNQLALQQQQQLAQGMMGEGFKPLDPFRTAGRYVVPISPLEGAAHAGKALAGAMMQRDTFKQQGDLAKQQQQAMRGLFGGGQPQPGASAQANPMSAGGASVMAPQPSPGGIQPLPQGQSQATPERGPLSMPGMSPTQSYLGFSISPDAYVKKWIESQGPNTEFTKLLQDAGIDPQSPLGKQLVQAQIAKQNYVAPTTFRPNTPVRDPFDPQKVIAFNPELPAGSQPVFDAKGNVTSVTPIPGVTDVMAAHSTAQASGPAQFRQERIPGPGGSEIPVTASQLPQALGAPVATPPSPQPQRRLEPIPGTVPASDRAAFDSVASGAVPRAYGAAPRTQTTSEKAESTEYGQSLGKQAGGVNEAAGSAAISNRYLDVMEDTVKSFEPGKLTPLQSQLTQWAQAVGLPLSDDLKKQAGDIQALTSMAIRMAGQATRAADAQPSQLQYLKILESMPDAQRTPEGFSKIVGYLRDTNNQAIAKAQALQQWRAERGTADGFDAAWPQMASQLPFAWNRSRRADDLKSIVGSTPVPSSSPSGKVVNWGDLRGR